MGALKSFGRCTLEFGLVWELRALFIWVLFRLFSIVDWFPTLLTAAGKYTPTYGKREETLGSKRVRMTKEDAILR